QARARPLRESRGDDVSVRGAELQLVAAQAVAVEKERAVDLALMLRARGHDVDEAVVPDILRIQVGGVREAADRREMKAPIDLGDHAGDVEAVTEDLGILDLGGRRAGSRMTLVPGGRKRPSRSRITAHCALVVLEAEEGQRVLTPDLDVELAIERRQ